MSTHSNFFVIVNYNGGNHIISCIQSIFASKNITPHIIIVDNDSTDNSIEKCKSNFPKITYIINTHNTGFGAGANIGIRHSLKKGAHTITLINPDATLDSSCMHNILNILNNKNTGIVSPVIYKNDKKNIWFSGGYINFWRMRAVHAPTKDFLQPLPKNAFISGCVMTVSHDVFEKIGCFDERFFLYYEDADLCVRAQKNGFDLMIAKDATAYHEEVSENFQKNKIYFLVLSGLLFFSKHTQFLKKLYFQAHYLLRKIKNFIDLKRKKEFSEIVHKAFIDYEKKQ